MKTTKAKIYVVYYGTTARYLVKAIKFGFIPIGYIDRNEPSCCSIKWRTWSTKEFALVHCSIDTYEKAEVLYADYAEHMKLNKRNYKLKLVKNIKCN